MSGQGIMRIKGKEAFEDYLETMVSIIKGVIEIHISEVSIRKYKNGVPNGTIIFTLPDNTITGHISGVLKYMLNIVNESNRNGMDLIDHLISEIKKLDLEVSEDVA